MMETDICILGAGFAGIGAGEAAHESGRETVLIEQMSTWGGALRFIPSAGLSL